MGQIVFAELLYQFITIDKPIVPGNIFKILRIVGVYPSYSPKFDMTTDPGLCWESDKYQSFARLLWFEESFCLVSLVYWNGSV